MGNRRRVTCTTALIVINVIVFFVLSFGGMTEDGMYMLEHGAMFTPNFIVYKEYYRIFTCMFLHFGFNHLVNNMLTLYIMGRNLEPVIGKVYFILIYLLSGIGGNVLTLAAELYTGDFAISAGASGAIFGLTGALLCLTILNRGRIAGVTKQGIMIMIAMNLYNGFTSRNVGNLAHIGGLLTGFILVLILCPYRYIKCRAHRGR